jgi:hypothetical protein
MMNKYKNEIMYSFPYFNDKSKTAPVKTFNK